jgi:hypothetical protein
MNKSQHMLTKTCSSCNLQKPLSAFLEMTSTRGAVYGNICSSCRKTAAEKNKKPGDHEGTTTGTDLKIDAKAKVHGDIGKKQHHQLVEELYHEDRDKEEIKQTQQEQRTQVKTGEEKKHRDTFLKKSSFLDSSKSSNVGSTQKVFGGQEHTASESEINLSAPVLEVGGKEKFRSVRYQQLKGFLGNTPFVRHAEKAAKKLDPKGNLTQENEIEVVEKLSGPSSRKT